MEQNKFRIEVLDSDIRFFCGGNEFVLEAMKRSGCGPVRCGCFGGGCGVCKMRIISGNYLVEKKMSRAHITEREQEDGIVLICCVKPRGDLIIGRV